MHVLVCDCEFIFIFDGSFYNDENKVCYQSSKANIWNTVSSFVMLQAEKSKPSLAHQREYGVYHKELLIILTLFIIKKTLYHFMPQRAVSH